MLREVVLRIVVSDVPLCGKLCEALPASNIPAKGRPRLRLRPGGAVSSFPFRVALLFRVLFHVFQLSNDVYFRLLVVGRSLWTYSNGSLQHQLLSMAPDK